MGIQKLLNDLKLWRLKRRGLKVGKNFKFYNTRIDYSHCFLIEIGDDVIISNSTILAHDATTKIALGKTKIGRVSIGDRVFVGYGSIILPNVSIGSDVIIAAGVL
ncbi:DapH/DapD/GlmU-related protein [Ectobacillus antri]|uniref:DapH/DapD/GlmU-related protein n=1 Tax=Ectobacillus antri TaxID=2486280 RepID=A0ABT6H843_9BACI|nr:DapH/DapD/GlmU-related protein [Ectobacillus antri]MDG4658483.1 DapH/DapD/GlmU-related protein [Ectobacillus antri]MDG5755491.1 DapH/DapD/GlmU-related protein [Ectobacillus antri]